MEEQQREEEMENEKQRKERIRQMRISKGERNGFNPLQASMCLQKTEMRLKPLVAAFGWGVDGGWVTICVNNLSWPNYFSFLSLSRRTALESR